MKILTSQDLIISEVQLEDRQFFYNLMNSPGWLQHIGDRGIRSLKDAENHIQNNLLVSYQKHGFGLYKVCLKIDHTPIGICGFLQRYYLEHPDLGFAMLPKYVGHGWMKEAANALLDHAKTKLNWTEILAITSPENERSQGLLRTLAFQEKGIIQPEEEALLLFQKKLL